MKCLNRDTLEYRVLKKVSGVSGFNLDSCIKFYLDTYGRYPHLDEIPGANSEADLNEVLEITETAGIRNLKLKKVKEFTGVDTVEEAIPILNDKYRDLEIDLTAIDEDIAIIKVNRRPSEYGFLNKNITVNTDGVNSRSVIVKSMNKLSRLYGINFKEITNDELKSEEWAGKIPEAHGVNAFIYNGDVYINTDVVSQKEEPKIHELLHMFLGSMRYTNPQLYFALVQSMEQLPTVANISNVYKNRTHSDILEEAFVTEYSKYLTGQKSAIDELSQDVLSEINYNIRRTLDSVLMGNYSVGSLTSKEIMNSTLSQLSQKVESDACSPSFPAFINVAAVHRRIANTKTGLIESKQLEEICH